MSAAAREAATAASFDVAIIGTGFAGIAAAARLIEQGRDDVVVLERASDLGGTWRDNTYPGAACDIRSDLYSLSFAPNPDWRHAYGRQEEILAYLHDVARTHGVLAHVRFAAELLRASWDADAGRWHLHTSTGDLTARVLLSGHGPFGDPHLPRIPGAETFAGTVLHSSSWDASVAIEGARVGVIGTGASAIQLVPELARRARELTVFQRSAPWIIPRHDRPTSAARRALFRRAPWLQRLARGLEFTLDDARWFGFASPALGAVIAGYARAHLRRQVRDTELRRALTPGYRIGCKRVLVSDDYYPALTRPDVQLVTDGIARLEPEGVVTDSGRRIPLDVLVYATGFDATRPSIAARIVGVGGRSLAEEWEDGMYALRGATVPGFPNLFLLHGPNAALSHNSAVYMIERQVHYAVQAIATSPEDAVIEARPEAVAAYRDRIARGLARGVWSTGGCTSYYLDAGGANTFLWPYRAARFARVTHRFDPTEYTVGRSLATAAGVRAS
ncbi:NAD(P)/FAD-dependent oxidoreductase [Leifsonia sp. NPDC080035]|uniref:NAD(P)/FAD-dependent oxidoreductase n=1 Tax=Leifsonia sp. NPDC080035 TaxID=3143936 RepID=A0AAU7GB59_9MICO